MVEYGCVDLCVFVYVCASEVNWIPRSVHPHSFNVNALVAV